MRVFTKSFLLIILLILPAAIFAQATDVQKAEAVFSKALEKLGGDRYLQVKTEVSSGYFTRFKEGFADLPAKFTDVIALPDKERTEFKSRGVKSIQTNSGDNGWLFDSDSLIIKQQSASEIVEFKRSVRVSLNYFMRGLWRKDGAILTYIGKRPGMLGKRNEVLKLVYSDGLTIEYEFTDEYIPVKAAFKVATDSAIIEEDRYGQFIDVDGIKVPFIVDHFRDGTQTSRINFDKIEHNKIVSDSVFAKPTNIKDLKKDLKL